MKFETFRDNDTTYSRAIPETAEERRQLSADIDAGNAQGEPTPGGQLYDDDEFSND